jgi:hypothetical protein
MLPMVEIWYDDIMRCKLTFAQLGLPERSAIYPAVTCFSSKKVTINAPLPNDPSPTNVVTLPSENKGWIDNIKDYEFIQRLGISSQMFCSFLFRP